MSTGSVDEDTGTVSWSELYDETRQRLARSAVECDADVEARWIIEEATGASGTDFHDALREFATVRGVARLDAMVGRRLAGEPIQYVLGHWAFRELDLFVDHRVLIPRPETEVLVTHALAELDRQRPEGSGTVVDLGTGSGAIGLSIVKERPGTRVALTDKSDDALAVARANLAGLGIIGGTVEIFGGRWYTALPERLLGECDVIVANPPYVRVDATLPASVIDWEPLAALFAGEAGLDDLRVVISDARRWLRPGGAVVVELDPEQVETVRELAETHGYETAVHADLAGHARVVVARDRR